MSDDARDLGLADTADGAVRRPAALPGAVLGGAAIAVLLLILVGLAIRDLVIRVGWAEGDEWLGGAVRWGSGSGWHGWMWVAAVVLVLLGLGLLWTAVKPRRQRHVAVGDGGVLWTRPVDIARRCSAAVRDLPGVDTAATVYHRRRVRVDIRGDAAVVDVAAAADTVRGALADVGSTPKIVIKVHDRKEPR